jgi:uncharacterized ion transporter superfamily protein YfcC
VVRRSANLHFTTRMRLPHPILLLLGGVALAAALTWILPAGEYERRDDPATGRRVVVAGTYHRVPQTPVGPFRAVVAVPRGIAEGADVIAVIFLVGGALTLLERVGVLARAIRALLGRLHGRGIVALIIVSIVCASLGAIENAQEEFLGLIPVLLVLSRSLGFDPLVAVAMSVGAAGVGSTFGPTNPFQASIALKLAQLPLLSGWQIRLAAWGIALALWIAWTIRYAQRHRTTPPAVDEHTTASMSRRDAFMLVLMLAPLVAFVYGTLRLDWGFNELSGVFVVAALAVGLLSGLGASGTVAAYLEAMKELLPAAMLVAVARSISLVLADGHVIDTILHSLAEPLGTLPAALCAALMIPVHWVIHIAVPSVSGQAVLTMPVMLPLADLLHLPRNAAVLAYQTGAGLADILVPTNGAIMAVLLAAGVPFDRWIRFAAVGCGLAAIVGLLAIAASIVTGLP